MVEAFGIVAAGSGCDGLRAKPWLVGLVPHGVFIEIIKESRNVKAT